MLTPSTQMLPDALLAAADVSVVIPVLNEEEAIGRVLSSVPSWVREIIVVDNGSTDHTAQVVRQHGAKVVIEPRRGYGSACQTGIAALHDPKIVVFLDGDFSDHAEEMSRLVAPIVEDRADLVIGSRVLGRCEPGALTLPQRFGNAMTCRLMRVLCGARCSDLGPFRAIRFASLIQLNMDDIGFGWTLQMQLRAVQHGLRLHEVPVSYRRRIGRSKISGTLRGVIGAGSKILYTMFNEMLRPTTGSKSEQLVVFARYPQPGLTKTRLIPALSPEGAATLQHRMTLGLLRQARRLQAQRTTRIRVCFAGGSVSAMRSLYGLHLRFKPQRHGDLGTRLSDAMSDSFKRGARRVVAVGTDCPALTAELMSNAFDALTSGDVVLGPASDGGYYLIGLRRMHPSLFENIDWGTDRVLAQTQEAAAKLGLSVRMLRVLDDVDRPEDLRTCEVRASDRLAAFMTPAQSAPFISVVIPTLNEQGNIGRAIRSASGSDDGEVEIIVVDGGSADATADVARACGAKLLRSDRGRARQMNAGAAAAGGQILLFLHADSCLPPDFVQQVRKTLAAPETVAGAFALDIVPSSVAMRSYASITNFRSRALQLPYGDQAIFLTRATFDRMGGYRDMPVMEDLDLNWRLRRLGTVRIANRIVKTSARRWLSNGTLRTSLHNQFLILAYLLKTSPQRLHVWRETGIIPPWRSLL